MTTSSGDIERTQRNTRIRRAARNFLMVAVSIVIVWTVSVLFALADLDAWILVALATTFATVALGLAVNRVSTQVRPQDVEDPGDRLEARITAVHNAFREAEALLHELSRDLEEQQRARQAVIAEADEQQRLLAINKEQAEAVRQVLVGEAEAAARVQFRREWTLFAAGLVLSIPIGIVVNLLT